ncbi:MAG: hypothetical protein WA879_07560 [Candidatus Acidiferrales bacterium]
MTLGRGFSCGNRKIDALPGRERLEWARQRHPNLAEGAGTDRPENQERKVKTTGQWQAKGVLEHAESSPKERLRSFVTFFDGLWPGLKD